MRDCQRVFVPCGGGEDLMSFWLGVNKHPHDKGKGIMIEEPVVEQVKPMKRLEQIRLDEELAFKLQAEKEEEARLAKEKA
ncbi:hypothetical protein Tco_0039633 [Tanacetum coccineum]